jgi:transcription antitermination factor NusG
MTDWCILRTSGRSTMGLAESLIKDGYEAWTPVETKTIRVPRINAKRQVRLPIMPSYVFVRVSHLVDMLQLAEMPVKPRRGAGRLDPAHASFTVLHAFGRIPIVADRHLVELRKIEAKRTERKRAERSLPVGVGVRINGGAAEGMLGTVEKSDCAHTVVCINDRYTIKIATSLLDLDGVCGANIAAKLAA